jgi:hypothetical protein
MRKLLYFMTAYANCSKMLKHIFTAFIVLDIKKHYQIPYLPPAPTPAPTSPSPPPPHTENNSPLFAKSKMKFSGCQTLSGIQKLLPDVTSNPAPTDKMSFSLDLRVEDRLHPIVVEAVGFAKVDNGKPIR